MNYLFSITFIVFGGFCLLFGIFAGEYMKLDMIEEMNHGDWLFFVGAVGFPVFVGFVLIFEGVRIPHK
tara:strand:+ start:9335 stop:9538 length:204 start_codon:yes stop_codon:yes gene_type:complete